MSKGSKPALGFDDCLFVSVDVDSFDRYLSIYGVADPTLREELVERTWTLGVERFRALFDELAIPAVFFTVGEDLANATAGQVARSLASGGHAMGNHTQTHRYDFIRLPESQARVEVEACQESIAGAVGTRPLVFRAPGYNMTASTYALLEQADIPFDSSPLPSYPYLGLKYAVMASLVARGRKSSSIWGNPAHFLGSRKPKLRGNVTVLPCATTPWLRVPVIGTFMSVLPSAVVDAMASALEGPGFVALEFHAIDLVNWQEDGLPEALKASRDTNIPVSIKRDRYKRFLERMLRNHRPWVPHPPEA